MKNIDVQKIRHLLQSLEWIHVAFHEDDYFCPCCKRSKEDGHYKDCQLKQALALLPCKTCGGTGQCKDPKAGNSNMLTLMECPDCQQPEIR